MPLEVESFHKLAIIVKLVGLAKMGHDIASDLDVALQEHADARLAAYGTLAIKPNFCHARLLPRQLHRDEVLLDTFTCERHDNMAKEAANPIDNTRRFERSVLSRFVMLQQESLLEWKMDGLQKPPPDTKFSTITIFSTRIKFNTQAGYRVLKFNTKSQY